MMEGVIDVDWNTFFHVINTTDTVLGVLFLATSWIVARRTWLHRNHEEAREERLGAAGAEEAAADEDAR